MFTWGRADYGQLGRKLESHEDWKLQNQDPSHPCSGPQKSMPSSLHCLTGAAEVGSDFPLEVMHLFSLSCIEAFTVGLLCVSSGDIVVGSMQDSERVLASSSLGSNMVEKVENLDNCTARKTVCSSFREIPSTLGLLQRVRDEFSFWGLG